MDSNREAGVRVGGVAIKVLSGTRPESLAEAVAATDGGNPVTSTTWTDGLDLSLVPSVLALSV